MLKTLRQLGHRLRAIELVEIEVHRREIERQPRQARPLPDGLEGADRVVEVGERGRVVVAPVREHAEVLETEGAVAVIARGLGDLERRLIARLRLVAVAEAQLRDAEVVERAALLERAAERARLLQVGGEDLGRALVVALGEQHLAERVLHLDAAILRLDVVVGDLERGGALGLGLGVAAGEEVGLGAGGAHAGALGG